MRIGIDVDETLVSSNDAFEFIKKKYNINFNKKFNEYWTKEECESILPLYGEEVLKNSNIKDGAKEILDYLSRTNTLIVITARNNLYCKNAIEITKQTLFNFGIKIDEYYFGQKIKSDIAKKLKIDLMIDDSKKIYNNMKKENIDCILFGDEIKTWKEVLDYIESRGLNG